MTCPLMSGPARNGATATRRAAPSCATGERADVTTALPTCQRGQGPRGGTPLAATKPVRVALPVLSRHPQDVARAAVIGMAGRHEEEIGQAIEIGPGRMRDGLAGP